MLRQVGPTVHIVAKMVEDIMKFFLIFVLFNAGFAMGFFMLSAEGYDDIHHSMLHTFTMNLGDFDTGAFENLTSRSHVYIGITLFVIYNLISPILLVNLLIAIMSDTYAKYSEASEAAWRMQQAMFILAEQARIDDKKYHKKYSVSKLWVLDKDRPLHGLAHFDDNPVAWAAIADTDNEVSEVHKQPRMLSILHANGQTLARAMPSKADTSVLHLEDMTMDVREALLKDLLESKNVDLSAGVGQ